MPVTHVNDIDVHYETQGQGTAVIFIHGGFGGAQSSLILTPNVVTDAVPQDRFKLITYDRRGAGASEYVDSWYSLEDLATDARRLLDALEIEESIVIGSSMGGMVAQQYTLLFPDKVQALALLNTGPNLMGGTSWGQASAKTVSLAKEQGDQAVFAQNLERLRNPPEPPSDPNRTPQVAERMAEVREAYLAALRGTSDEELLMFFTGVIRNYAAFIGYDFTAHLGGIVVPTLILHGTADTTVPYSDAEILSGAITQAELHSIPDAIHGILQYSDARDVLTKWLLNLL